MRGFLIRCFPDGNVGMTIFFIKLVPLQPIINKFFMKKSLLLVFPLIFSAAAIAQDNCATALPISIGTHVVAAVNGSQVPAPLCAANGTGNTSAGEWYVFTPDQDLTVMITTDLPINSGTDTRFHVYTGTCSALACHAGDDDSGGGYTSVSVFDVVAGTPYYIAFDNRS